jgi:hypothetical protein
LQSVWVEVHPALHMPLPHTWVAGHTVPHEPQFDVLLARLTHWPEQLTVPVGHLHAPPEQNIPPEQARPQPPQLLSSFCVSTHALPQDVRLVAHCAWHTPELQNGVAAAHLFAQAPQLPGSVCSLTHAPAQ